MKDFAGERGMSMGIPWPGGDSWHLGYIVTLTYSNFSFSSSLVNEAELSETDYVRIGKSICLFLVHYSWEECFCRHKSSTRRNRNKKTSLPISLTATNLSPNSPFFSSSSLMIPPPPSHLYSSLYSSLHPPSQKSP